MPSTTTDHTQQSAAATSMQALSEALQQAKRCGSIALWLHKPPCSVNFHGSARLVTWHAQRLAGSMLVLVNGQICIDDVTCAQLPLQQLCTIVTGVPHQANNQFTTATLFPHAIFVGCATYSHRNNTMYRCTYQHQSQNPVTCHLSLFGGPGMWQAWCCQYGVPANCNAGQTTKWPALKVLFTEGLSSGVWKRQNHQLGSPSMQSLV